MTSPARVPVLLFGDAARGVSDVLGAAVESAWAALVAGARNAGLRWPPHGAEPPGPLRVPALVASSCAGVVAIAPPGSRWATAFAEAWAEHASTVSALAAGDAGEDTRGVGAVGRALAPLSVLALVALDLAAKLAPLPTSRELLDETFGVYLGVVVLADPTASPTRRWTVDALATARRLEQTWCEAGFDAVGALVRGWSLELEAHAGRESFRPAPQAAATGALARVIEGALSAGLALLDDDSDCAEAFEVYRWGFLEHSSLISRVFPVGTILENRIRAGDVCPGAVDALVRRYADNRFHYFDTPTALPFDIDTFGLVARLARRGTEPGDVRRVLDRPLGWVLANVSPEGDIPVFLTRGVDAGDGRRYILTLGNACAGVQANLLLGMLELPAPRPTAAIAKIGAYLCARFAREARASFAHYDALYGTHVVHQAVEQLDGLVPGALCSAARATAVEILAEECSLDRSFPLETAWQWLATAADSTRHLRRLSMIEALLENQEADGGWRASPFYRVPSRGNHIESYRSRLLTTSFVCLALASARSAVVPR